MDFDQDEYCDIQYLDEAYALCDTAEQEYIEFYENIDVKYNSVQWSEDNEPIVSPFDKGVHLHSDAKTLLIIFYDFLMK